MKILYLLPTLFCINMVSIDNVNQSAESFNDLTAACADCIRALKPTTPPTDFDNALDRARCSFHKTLNIYVAQFNRATEVPLHRNDRLVTHYALIAETQNKLLAVTGLSGLCSIIRITNLGAKKSLSVIQLCHYHELNDLESKMNRFAHFLEESSNKLKAASNKIASDEPLCVSPLS